MKRNIKLTLEYDGTNYHGWQSQAGSGQPTIQETLEQAIRAITGEEIRTYSSGRTDAGVHALGHVVNFHTNHAMPPEAWAPALNHQLPSDIRVLASERVADDFHARYSALGKIYRYRILNRRAPTALYRNYAWHVNVPLESAEYEGGCSLSLIGKHDFSAFRSSGCSAKSPVRTLRRIEIKESDGFVEIWLEADAFLQYMVRNIAGTLVEVGLGRFVPGDVGNILESRDRSHGRQDSSGSGSLSDNSVLLI